MNILIILPQKFEADLVPWNLCGGLVRGFPKTGTIGSRNEPTHKKSYNTVDAEPIHIGSETCRQHGAAWHNRHLFFSVAGGRNSREEELEMKKQIKKLVNQGQNFVNSLVSVAANANNQTKQALTSLAGHVTGTIKKLKGTATTPNQKPQNAPKNKAPKANTTPVQKTKASNLFGQQFKTNGGKPLVTNLASNKQIRKLHAIAAAVNAFGYQMLLGLKNDIVTVVVAPKGAQITKNIVPKGTVIATAIQNGKLHGIPQNILTGKLGQKVAKAIKNVASVKLTTIKAATPPNQKPQNQPKQKAKKAAKGANGTHHPMHAAPANPLANVKFTTAQPVQSAN